ncbi:MAG: Hsp20/alpha crystallin family protein [Bdellovibrionota bacterium]
MKQKYNHIKPEFLFDPFRFFDSFNRDFDQIWSRPLAPTGATVQPVFIPEVDVVETDDHYLMCADLPGFRKEDIKIEVTPEGSVTLKGTRNISHNMDKAETLLSERRAGVFERSLQLAKGVDADKVSADYENGVLRIALPKVEKVQKKLIQIGEPKGDSGKSLFKWPLGNSSNKSVEEK